MQTICISNGKNMSTKYDRETNRILKWGQPYKVISNESNCNLKSIMLEMIVGYIIHNGSVIFSAVFITYSHKADLAWIPWTSNENMLSWWRHQMEHFRRYWPFMQGIRSSPVNSLHNGQWRGAFMFSLICAWKKRLSKQSWGWWFETPSCPLWRHCNDHLHYKCIPGFLLSCVEVNGYATYVHICVLYISLKTNGWNNYEICRLVTWNSDSQQIECTADK